MVKSNHYTYQYIYNTTQNRVTYLYDTMHKRLIQTQFNIKDQPMVSVDIKF